MGSSRKWPCLVLQAFLAGLILAQNCVFAVPSDSVNLSNMEENPGSVSHSGLTESQKNSLLQLHNAFRSIVKPTASNMIRMSWDPELEKIASDFAEKCIVAHNPDRHKQAKHYDWVGENIAWGTGLCGDKECGDVFEGVKRWFSESKNYNFITGQCSGKCTLYTQMAWWESNKLGCGAKRCGDRTILVCNYAPGGNYVGQKPYRQGKPCSDCPKGSICDNNLCVPPDQQGSCRNCINKGKNQNRQETPDLSSNQMPEEEIPLPTPTPTKNPLLPNGWQELPVHLIQVDSGMSSFTWGLNARNTPFLLELDNMLTRINGTLHHVSAGQSGVWGIGLLGNIFLRTGITEENPRGLLWERVRGNLKQIDSGPAGVVWGVNRFDRVFCRIGISAQAPAGTGWRLIPGNLKYVSCGEFGCWGVDKQGTIFFRKGVTPGTPEGAEWKTVPGSLRMIESGPHGITVGVRESPEGVQDVLYRTGVSHDKPEGLQWMKLPVKLSHVTVGNRGIMGIMHNGAVVLHKELQVRDDAMPTLQPEMEVGTTAVPLERNMAVTDHPSTPEGGIRTFAPTTPRTYTAPLISAGKAAGQNINKHVSHQNENVQEKDPLKITPELANKILNMIQEKGNDFEMTHKAAAQKMQRNISASHNQQPNSLQQKLVSPPAPQPPSNIKNATAAQNAATAPAPQPPVAVEQQQPPPVMPQPNSLDENKGKAGPQSVTPNPTSSKAFQDALQKLTTKATSEATAAPLPTNKTAPETQAPKVPQSPPPKLPSPNSMQQPAPSATQPQHATAQQTSSPNQPINAHQPATAVSKPSAPAQQPKAPAELPHSQPVQPQNAVNEQRQQPQPEIHANQPIKEPSKLQPQLDSKGQPTLGGGLKMVTDASPAQGPLSSKPSVAAPVQGKPNIQPQTKEQKVAKEQFSIPITRPTTHRMPTRKPSLAVTQRANKFGAQLLTATRPENMHHVVAPTGAVFKPTPPGIVRTQHPNMQAFPTKAKYRDEDYDIGLIGRKHLNEISSGAKVQPTARMTQKPIHTAPVTNAVTVSYDLTRSCCAIPDSVCPIPRDCTGYIECKGYNGFYRVCERGKMFHPFKNICDYPRNVDCETIKVGGTLANSMESQDTDFALRSNPTKPLAAQAPAAKQLPPGSDFMDFEEHSTPQRGMAQTSAANEEVPEPRITAPEGGNSGVLREVWFGLGLSPHLKDLINNPRFPQTPDEYLILDKFEAPPNAGDGYGQRLSTYFRAPLTGDYLFYLSCDNECELWLSPDTDELNSSMSIELKNGHYTSYRQWTKYPNEQTSRPVKMEKDKFYFMESFMKEGTGGDNLSIGVRFPDGKVEMPIFNNLFLIPALTGPASTDKNLKSGRTKQLLENAQYNNLPVQENYLERPDRVQNFESDLDMFNARKRTSVRRDSE